MRYMVIRKEMAGLLACAVCTMACSQRAPNVAQATSPLSSEGPTGATASKPLPASGEDFHELLETFPGAVLYTRSSLCRLMNAFSGGAGLYRVEKMVSRLEKNP